MILTPNSFQQHLYDIAKLAFQPINESLNMDHLFAAIDFLHTLPLNFNQTDEFKYNATIQQLTLLAILYEKNNDSHNAITCISLVLKNLKNHQSITSEFFYLLNYYAYLLVQNNHLDPKLINIIKKIAFYTETESNLLEPQIKNILKSQQFLNFAWLFSKHSGASVFTKYCLKQAYKYTPKDLLIKSINFTQLQQLPYYE